MLFLIKYLSKIIEPNNIMRKDLKKFKDLTKLFYIEMKKSWNFSSCHLGNFNIKKFKLCFQLTYIIFKLFF